MRWHILAVLAAVYALLLVAGGLVFHALEQHNEETTALRTQDYLQRILEERPCLSAEDVTTMVVTVVRAYDQGVITSYLRNGTSTSASASNWDVASAIFFASTVATTIGYGHIAPSTVGGRLFCVFYALLTIPLCLTLLTALAGKMTKLLYYDDDIPGESEKPPGRRLGRAARTLLFTAGGVGVFLLGPAGVFLAIEGWSYADAVYYAFVTLTTIGFGDYVAGINPEQSSRAVYRLMTGVWIIVGLAWLSTVISLFQGSVQDALARLEQRVEERLGRRKKNVVEERREEKEMEQSEVTDLRVIAAD